jgi:hypothetical protein
MYEGIATAGELGREYMASSFHYGILYVLKFRILRFDPAAINEVK